MDFETAAELAIIVYPTVFIVLGSKFRWEYFKTIPDGLNAKEMAEYDRQEGMSQNLAGFALTALTFLVGFFSSRLAEAETLLSYFTLGLMLELFSAFLTHYRVRHAWKYIGFVLQYTGLLALILGFGVFFEVELPTSTILVPLFWIFVVGFMAITFPELYFDYRQGQTKGTGTLKAAQ